MKLTQLDIGIWNPQLLGAGCAMAHGTARAQELRVPNADIMALKIISLSIWSAVAVLPLPP